MSYLGGFLERCTPSRKTSLPVYALHTKTTRGRGGVPCVERAALVLHTEVEQRALWSDPTSVANTAAATTLPVKRAIHI